MSPMKVSAVILTTGDRPQALQRAVDGLRAQDLLVEVVIVWNGASPVPGLADVDVVTTDNVGIPAGRNRGAAAATGDAVLFLDDDAWTASATTVSTMLARMEQTVAVVGAKITDPDTGRTLRRWSPGIGIHPGGPAPAFPGGASLIRRQALEQIGGFCDEYFYSHEETDLSWRLVDAGWTLIYEPGAEVHHPVTSTTRHPDGLRRSSRNRVWLARRLLPFPVAVVHVAIHTARSLTMARSWRNVQAVLRGMGDGFRAMPGDRAPIRWRTVARLTSLGRPPIV